MRSRIFFRVFLLCTVIQDYDSVSTASGSGNAYTNQYTILKSRNTRGNIFRDILSIWRALCLPSWSPLGVDAGRPSVPFSTIFICNIPTIKDIIGRQNGRLCRPCYWSTSKAASITTNYTTTRVPLWLVTHFGD